MKERTKNTKKDRETQKEVRIEKEKKGMRFPRILPRRFLRTIECFKISIK